MKGMEKFSIYLTIQIDSGVSFCHISLTSIFKSFHYQDSKVHQDDPRHLWDSNLDQKKNRLTEFSKKKIHHMVLETWSFDTNYQLIHGHWRN